MSKLERIATFICVIEEQSFSGAARKLGISKAAVSRQVTALESELGAQLLQRSTRHLSVTPLGSDYYQQCKKTLEDLKQAEEAIVGSQQEATGILNIVSNRYFALNYLFPSLKDFMILNPKLRFRFDLSERFPDFSQEGVDILLGVSMEGPKELVRRRVATTRYVLCASPRYLEAYGTPSAPTDLLAHRYITHSMRKPNNLIKFKNNKEIYIEPFMCLNDSFAMRECAIQDMGIVMLHDYFIADAIKDQRLIEVLSRFQEPSIPVFLYFNQSRYLQPKIRRFIDFFLAHMEI